MPPPPPRPPGPRNHNAEASCKTGLPTTHTERPPDVDLTVETLEPDSKASAGDLPSSLRSGRTVRPPNLGQPLDTHLTSDTRRAKANDEDDPRGAHLQHPPGQLPRRPFAPSDIRSYLASPEGKNSEEAIRAESKHPDLKGLNADRHHRYKRIATPRVITLNIRGLSAAESASRSRLKRVRQTLKSLAGRADVICLQEVMCDLKSLVGLKLLPGFRAYANPSRTAILIRESLLVDCAIVERILDSGYIHSVEVTPTGPNSVFLASWTVLNVYLQCGATAEARSKRANQIELLSKYTPPTDFLLATGDWNMVLSDNDTSSGSHEASRPEDRKSLRSALHDLHLREAYQPDHTRFGVNAAGNYTSSRLDRHYYSHSTSLQTIMKPSCEVLPLPIAARANPEKGIAALTDHRPVLLIFQPNGVEKGFRFKIPSHVADDTLLHKAIEAEWATVKKPNNPIHLLSNFKKLIVKHARAAMAERRSLAESNSARLTVAISLLGRGLAGTRPIVLRRRFGGVAPDLVHLFKRDFEEHKGSAFPALTNFIAGQLAEPSFSPPPTQEKRVPFNFLKYAKNTLPSSREHITSLDTDAGVVDRAEDIAAELKKHWEPIWAKKNIPWSKIRDYLATYPKRVCQQVKRITLKIVRATILKPRQSSAGRDGIPFSLYKALVDIAAPIFLKVIQHLESGKPANRSFNWADIFFIPKKRGIKTALQTRPISVSNTDNRIIANCLLSVLALPLNSFVDPSQHAFLHGRSIETPIRRVNQRFYEALSSQEQLQVLLIDFAKAFDSVSTKFLFSLLRHIGIPEWALNIVHALYAKVKARPILAEKHRVWINMADGLKQGCPLSPVFFAVVMDPLLYCLKQIHQVEPLGFADDLSVIYSEVGTGNAIAKTIDAYSRVSGPLVNFTKTVILCTLGDGEDALDELPLTWNAVKCSEFERYLGTFVGRKVDVNKVFMQAWDKLTNRLRQYTPVKHTFNLQGRVDIANSFLLPLFSFLFRFYMMTKSFMDDVEKAIAKWVVPNSRYQFDHLTTLPAAGGIHRPLRSVFLTNIATLLRKTDDPPAPDDFEYDLSSCHMAMHRRIAARYYHHLCDTPPPPMKPSRIFSAPFAMPMTRRSRPWWLRSAGPEDGTTQLRRSLPIGSAVMSAPSQLRSPPSSVRISSNLSTTACPPNIGLGTSQTPTPSALCVVSRMRRSITSTPIARSPLTLSP